MNHPTAACCNLPLHGPIDLTTHLEAPNSLESCLTRLHPLAGDQPLVIGKRVADTKELRWPPISVVVCSYNGARTIRDTLASLQCLHYPAYEVIVVDDSSTDDTAPIVQAYGCRFVSTEKRGRSNARNTGMQVARGEIVAYIDDDAYPDPHWLTYLAITFIKTDHVGVGGSYLALDDDDWITGCVANAPEGPVHVLLCDGCVEHIPGCNMAFRKSTLQSIGGFDPRYHIAGDDVDVCWRLQQRGWTLGFQPAAVVRHHRYRSVRMYWKEQQEYGCAEVLLEEKWPLKHIEFGHYAWTGQRRGQGLIRTVSVRQEPIDPAICAYTLFQRPEQPVPNVLCVLPLMPNWYLLVGTLTLLAMLSLLWAPLMYSLPLLAILLGVPLGQAIWRAKAAVVTAAPSSFVKRLKYRLFTAFLHLLQPIARLYGRLCHRFNRRRGHQRLGLLWPRTISLWHQARRDRVDPLQLLESVLCDAALYVPQRGRGDRWELEVRGGLFGKVRTHMTIAEPESGDSRICFRVWPMGSTYSLVLSLSFALLCVGAIVDHAYVSAVILGSIAIMIVYRMWQESAWAMSGLLEGFKQLGAGDEAYTSTK